MELTFSVEIFATVHSDVAALATAHWHETEAAMYGPLAMDSGPPVHAAQYTALDQAGMLHLCTARAAGCQSLQGYAAFVLMQNMHAPGRITATLTALYLTPAVRRNPFTALRILRFAESGLHARGVFGVSYNSPHSRPCDALYRRLGANAVETIWYKEL